MQSDRCISTVYSEVEFPINRSAIYLSKIHLQFVLRWQGRVHFPNVADLLWQNSGNNHTLERQEVKCQVEDFYMILEELVEINTKDTSTLHLLEIMLHVNTGRSAGSHLPYLKSNKQLTIKASGFHANLIMDFKSE